MLCAGRERGHATRTGRFYPIEGHYLQRLWTRVWRRGRLSPAGWLLPRARFGEKAHEDRVADDGELVAVVVRTRDRFGDRALALGGKEDRVCAAAVDATQQRIQLGRARVPELAHVSRVAPRTLMDQYLWRRGKLAVAAVAVAHLIREIKPIDDKTHVPFWKRVGRVGLPQYIDRSMWGQWQLKAPLERSEAFFFYASKQLD